MQARDDETAAWEAYNSERRSSGLPTPEHYRVSGESEHQQQPWGHADENASANAYGAAAALPFLAASHNDMNVYPTGTAADGYGGPAWAYDRPDARNSGAEQQQQDAYHSPQSQGDDQFFTPQDVVPQHHHPKPHGIPSVTAAAAAGKDEFHPSPRPNARRLTGRQKLGAVEMLTAVGTLWFFWAAGDDNNLWHQVRGSSRLWLVVTIAAEAVPTRAPQRRRSHSGRLGPIVVGFAMDGGGWGNDFAQLKNSDWGGATEVSA
ncbi:hypothetical protein GQ53DRAFT_758891 [Thozetella sp. PMI_491]|nr:hypothetical protein GQ53DRAFT_758891 [Thozetella sp. PMI_491]